MGAYHRELENRRCTCTVFDLLGRYGSMVVDDRRLCEMDILFFFQAEDGIRDYKVTGVQTCALPICRQAVALYDELSERWTRLKVVYSGRGFHVHVFDDEAFRLTRKERSRIATRFEIGRASCRERV